jgi:hypothetical protein
VDDVTCPECSTPVDAQASICPDCGCRMEQATAERAHETVVDAAPPPRSHVPRRSSGDDPFAIRPLAVELAVESALGGRTVTLHAGDLLEIGREVGPLTALCTDNVSARHAELRVGHDRVEIRDTGRDDAGSTNGTYVDGERIAPGKLMELEDGSVISCGTDPPVTIRVTVVPP